jgi:hypothetical protein
MEGQFLASLFCAREHRFGHTLKLKGLVISVVENDSKIAVIDSMSRSSSLCHAS